MKSFTYPYLYFGIQIDWAANIRKSWDFSEDGACARLEAFLNDGETSCMHIVNSDAQYGLFWRKVVNCLIDVTVSYDSSMFPRCV